MKKLLPLLLLLFVCPFYGYGQTTATGKIVVATSSTKPATCSNGDVMTATDNFALYECGPTNTWTAVTSSGGSTTWVNLGGGTNSSSAFICGTGCSIGVSGSGTNTATNGVNSVVNDTNVTGSVSGSVFTLGWTGTQAVSRGGTGVGTLTGVVKGNGTSAFTAAVNTDITGLFTGTCNSSTFMRGDGSCQTVAVSNPVFQVNATPTSNQATINYQNSTTNAVGLNLVVSNPSVGNVKYEITGSSYTGNALTATTATTSTNLAGPGTVTGNYSHSGTETFTGLIQCKNFEQIRCVDNANSASWSGSDPGAWINAAEADLPTAGGTIDARGLTGAQTFTTPIVFNKKTKLLLGAGTYTGPSAGDIITVNGGSGAFNQGTTIEGSGQNVTILQPVTAAQASGIRFTPTNNGNTSYSVSNLSILDSTSGGTTRTAGAGIYADALANPAQNSIGEVHNVYIQYMYNGVYLNRPITTKISHVEVAFSKQDGIVMQGDGTTVTLDGTYSHDSGGWDYRQWGMAGVNYNNPAAQSGTLGGIRIERQTSSSASQQSVGINIISPDIEAEVGTGIYCLDCIGLNVSSTNLLNNGGDGIRIDGGRGVSLSGGQVKGSTGCGLNVTTSAAPTVPAAIFNLGMQFVGNTGGNECGGTSLLNAYSSLGYDGSPLARLAYPPTADGVPPVVTGTGACATITTQLGGAWGGSFVCTGTTGASTATITPGSTAAHGWNCSGSSDETAGTVMPQSAHNTTTCTIKGTVTTNDVIVFNVSGF